MRRKEEDALLQKLEPVEASFRSAYNEARKVKQAQDDYCLKAEMGLWEDIAGKSYPENLQWEMLVDVLRGRVKARTLVRGLLQHIDSYRSSIDCQSLL